MSDLPVDDCLHLLAGFSSIPENSHISNSMEWIGMVSDFLPSRPLWWLMTATGTVCPAMQQQKVKAFDWQLTLLTIWKWCSDCFLLSPFKRLFYYYHYYIPWFHGIFCFSAFLGGVIYWCHALWKRERYEKNQFQDLGPKTDNEICHRIQSINLFGSFWWVEFQHGKICFWMAAVFVFWSEDPIWPTHRSERLALVSALGTSQLRWEKLPGRWHDETIFRLCLFATFYSDWDYTLLYCTNVYLYHLVWGCPSKKDSQYHKNIECYKFHHHIYNTLLTSHQVHV